MIAYGKRVILQFFSDIPLKKKLLISFFILIMLPLSFLTALSNKNVSEAMEKQVTYSAQQAFEQTNSFLSYKIKDWVEVSDVIAVNSADVPDSISGNPEISKILVRDTSNYNIHEQLRDANSIIAFVTSFQFKYDIHRVRLYVRDGLYYSNENVNIFCMSKAVNTLWYKMMLAEKRKILWCPNSDFQDSEANSQPIISAVRPLIDPNLYSNNIGILRVDILESTINDIIKKAIPTKSGFVYLVNTAGTVMTQYGDTTVNHWGIDPEYIDTLANSTVNWDKKVVNGQKLMIGCKNVRNTDWTLVSVIPLSEILQESSKLRNTMLMTMIIAGALAYLLAFFISGSTAKRIGNLIGNMRKMQKGDLNVSVLSPGKDEIGELGRNFNDMVQKMKLLIEEQYKNGQEITRSELKALQAQINPHFLYNTLDMVNWIALEKDIPEITSIVQDLAKFYKLSLNKGQEMISLQGELEHVRIYVNIQNRRFDNRINLVFEIDERILPYNIVKLTLQPIVENSILHGIFEKDGKSGTITIKGVLEQEEILLSVMDDGVGMPEEKVVELFTSTDINPNRGYGIKNVHHRIKLRFGDKYGMTCKSTPGQGTLVEIRIPAWSGDSSI